MTPTSLPAAGPLAPADKWLSIVLLAVCVVLTLSLWFSVSAVVPTLKLQHGLTDDRAAWLASSVSIGFVAGTLTSALINLADRVEPRRLFMASALLAAGPVVGIAAMIRLRRRPEAVRLASGRH